MKSVDNEVRRRSKLSGTPVRSFALAGLLGLVTACANTGAPVSSRGASQATPATTTSVQGCVVTPFYDSELPATFTKHLRGPVIWMGGPGAVAVLFYTQGNPSRIEIGTHGIQGPGENSKILWLIDRPSGESMLIHAKNRDTGSEIQMTLPGGGNYPSIPQLPEAGCWDLTASTNGQARLTITIPAIDRR